MQQAADIVFIALLFVLAFAQDTLSEMTPILDLKPYITGYDSAKATVPNWLKHRKSFIAYVPVPA